MSTDTQDLRPAPAPSSLLGRPGAVAAPEPDTAVAAHYGDPLREQRLAATGAALVDRSNREVVRITGADRLTWLHSVTSQHLSQLAPMHGTEALVLSPHGHVEHHLVLADDGTATWIDVEPTTAPRLLAFLQSMRFLMRVEPVDVTAEVAVLSLTGPRADEVAAAVFGPAALPAPLAGTGTGGATGAVPRTSAGVVTSGPYPVSHAAPAGTQAAPDEQSASNALSAPDALAGGRLPLIRRMPHGLDLLVARSDLAATADRLTSAGAALIGLSAFEAQRIASRQPRLNRETDHRTIPHEVGWLASAVHLDKGCYRGQETVARVHNLGRPPRRLVLLHLDGTVAAPGCPVTAAGRTVGFVGSSEMHHELGPIALAVVKRSVALDVPLVVTDQDGAQVAAAIDPDAEPEQPSRPAGRLHGPGSDG
ncbi:glycine cleavage system protein T [Frankia sp. CcI49]|uniref:CAF17-like 4Fe-4S cluster assembly/insertion protein YgfZ n=1 Tax=Frankia sp. CcI49 TaxID=1745382 RepID=UPI000975946C|nr:folate-binding protein YgfZ [Frankia sp. CcI49]ONH59593.1 glycine cleavage system protein T [Frankia sp. CcI49]